MTYCSDSKNAVEATIFFLCWLKYLMVFNNWFFIAAAQKHIILIQLVVLVELSFVCLEIALLI
jgi:hypothetical protein